MVSDMTAEQKGKQTNKNQQQNNISTIASQTLFQIKFWEKHRLNIIRYALNKALQYGIMVKPYICKEKHNPTTDLFPSLCSMLPQNRK